jgi:DNA polymerase I
MVTRNQTQWGCEMRVVLDIETDDLNATVIHCIVAKDIDTGSIYTFKGSECYTDFPAFTKNVEKYIMHNGISFDAPVLKRLTGVDIKLSQIIDTMILSQLLNPMREGGHSLEAWGNTLGFPKIDFQNFTHLTDDMVKYCINDVQLTHRVYVSMLKDLETISESCVVLEHQIRALVNEQERNGFTLDIQKAMVLINKLKDKATEIEKEVKSIFFPLPVPVREVTPRFKKDGTLSTVGLRHFDDRSVVAGPHTSIEFQEFNLQSRQQIVRHLLYRGWKPSKFTEKGHPIVDESVLMEVDIPEAKKIAEYLLLEKRIAQVQSWLDLVEQDGKVHGKVLTLRAISGRMAHHSPNMAQVPAKYSPYGKECRECWTVSSTDNVLVGCDASSLELRGLAHYLQDKNFTKEVVEGDIHTANQKAAGLETRDQAKTFIYAFIYGAGPAKIGKIVGGDADRGRELIDTFLSNVPALATFRKKVDRIAKTGYLPGLDGRKLVVRSEHAAVNLLIQGAGAVICKQWLVEIHKLKTKYNIPAKLLGSIHDEYQFEVPKRQAEAFGKITKQAMKNVEKLLKVRCPLDSEYHIGSNWSETH